MMTREKLQLAQKEMRQRQAEASRVPQMKDTRQANPRQANTPAHCLIPLKWRYTVTLALRELIRSCHNSKNEQGCKVAVQCARELGLDVETVVKYTHLEKQEVVNAK